MKIALVLNTSWNIYNFRMGLVESLLRNGIEVYTIAPEDKFTQKLISKGCKYEKITMDSRGVNPFKDLALTFELYKIYKKIKPDIILHFTIKPNIYGTIAARILNIPSINNVCGLGTVFLSNNLISRLALQMYKLAFRYPRKVFFQNSDDKKLFLEKKLLKAELADILPGSGVDIDKYKPLSYQRNKSFTFLLVSRLILDKGILEYIEAAGMLKKNGIQATFQLLGPADPSHRRGIPIHQLVHLIKTNGIDYLGATDDVRPYINKADCIVLPSYREGTSKALLEAASSGKPIITTNVPGCNNIVKDHHNGFLCKLKNVEDLIEKMQNMCMLADEDLKKMGENSRKYIRENFDERFVIHKYLNTIQQVSA